MKSFKDRPVFKKVGTLSKKTLAPTLLDLLICFRSWNRPSEISIAEEAIPTNFVATPNLILGLVYLLLFDEITWGGVTDTSSLKLSNS